MSKFIKRAHKFDNTCAQHLENKLQIQTEQHNTDNVTVSRGQLIVDMQ